jgi:hypothetical protein
MAEKVKCKICEKKFKDENALAHHHEAKHTHPDDKIVSNSASKFKSWMIFFIIGAIIVGLAFWLWNGISEESNSCKDTPADELNIGGHTNLRMHIHPHIEITIDGEMQDIPGNIGIAQGIMRPVHTHDATGELHVEGPCQRDFNLGDLFLVWGKTFNSDCIFDNCVSSDGGKLTMTVNGQLNEEYENLVFRDKDRIITSFENE